MDKKSVFDSNYVKKQLKKGGVLDKHSFVGKNEVEVRGTLGTGNFGTVYEAYWEGSECALKLIKATSKQSAKQLQKEMSTWQKNIKTFEYM
eukprot:UN05488